MHWYVKNKNRKVFTFVLLAVMAIGAPILWGNTIRPVFAQSINQIPVALSLFGSDNKAVANGEYQIRFALYRVDRTIADAYPSNTDAGNRIWEETQTVNVTGGVVRAFLGSVNSLSNIVNFENGDYYLGVRIGTDSEMVPRKKLGAVPAALNAQYLRGKTFGTNAGDLVALDTKGKISIKQLPVGTGNNQLVRGDDPRLGEDENAHEQNTDLGTDSTVFTIGLGSALSGNFDLSVSSAGTPPSLRYNATLQAWQFSDDGTTFTSLSDSGSVDFLETADGTGSTSSYSGFELAGTDSDELALLQGCANGQGIAWNDATNVWECASFSAGLSGTGTNGYAVYWSGTSSLGSEQYLDESRGGTGLNASAASNGSILIGNGAGFTLNTLGADNGIAITNGGGTISIGLDVTTTGTTATTSSNSGLETTASGLRLLGGCSNDQVLAWSTGSSAWVCSNKSGGTSDWTSTGSLTYLTDATDDLVIGGTAADEGFFFDVSAGTLSFEGSAANGFETAIGVVNPTGDNAINFPNASGTVITTGNLTDITAVGTITSGTWNGGVIGTLYGGTGATSLNNLIALTTHTTGNYVASVGNGNGISGGSAGSEGAALTLAIDLLDSADGTGGTSSNSGLEFQGGSSNELTLLQGCADNEVLKWNNSTNVWECASVTGVGGLDGSGSANQVAYFTDSNTLTSEAQLAVSRGGTGIGSYTIGDILYASGSGTLAALNDVATGNVLISGGVGVAPSWGKVGLTTHVSGILPVANGGTGASSLNDLIALTTHTTGNYVQSITNGSGITGGDGGSEGAALTLALGALSADWNQTGAFDIRLNNAGSELRILESAGATYYGSLDVGDLSADRTLTLPDVSGVIATIDGGQTFTSATWNGSTVAVGYGGTGATTFTPNGVLYGNGTGAIQATSAGTNGQFLVGVSSSAPTFVTMGGDATIANDGTLTISNDAVALGTNTTGNYVASATSNGGLTMTGTEGGSLGVLLPSPTNGLSTTVNSGSGLELTSSGLSLLQGCNDNEVLSWDETNDYWECNSVGGVGAGDITAVGNVTGGAAFDGSAGTELYFNDVDGDGLLTIANLSAARTYTLPDVTGTIVTTGDTGSVTGTMILNDTVVLTTDTSGNYVQRVQTSVLTGLTGGSSGSEGADLTLALDYSQALSGNVGLAADAAVFGQSGLVFEGTSADNIETFFAVTDPTGSDKTITFPNASGTLILSGHTFTGDVTATLGSGGTTALTIASDSVALTTDTTGNYVATLTGGNGIAGSASSEGATPTLDIDLLDSDDSTGATSTNSGLEFAGASNDELTLLQGCADEQVLAWDNTTNEWECSDKTGGSSDFTDAGTFTYLTSTTDDFALGGSTTTSARFFFDVQTGNVIRFEGTGSDDANETALVLPIQPPIEQ
ncbi:MAG: hypothetical protein E6R05_02635 [Candidatus Moraniibacteriota bacterium]|nr:MAG: hypothetical protein E6R05_02635 [Candidatus Moranbacteria bacterium]